MLTFGIRSPKSFAAFDGIVLFGLLAMTARSATDPDIGWHLRTGQWIAATGHVPRFDPFSFTRAGHAWVAHEWLSEVIFYQLWKFGGATALIVFSALITTAGFLLLYLRCASTGRKRHWAAAATALGALAAAPAWGVRPQMFTFLLASLLLWLIEAGEDRPKLLLWIPPLFLLWLNLHGGFALAPALLIAYAVGVTIETAAGNTPWQQAQPILLRVALLLLAFALLIPLNPNGAELYRYPFDTLRSHGIRSFIGEWRSPDFHQSLYRPFLLLWLLLVTALACSRSRPRGRIMVPLLFMSFAALDAARHIPIFALLAMPVIAAALPVANGDPARKPGIARRRWTSASPFSAPAPIFNVAVVILMAAFALTRWISLARNESLNEAQVFPEQAVAFLHSGSYPPNLFVYYDWGGYAIWKLYPEYRVFVDGRADLYGDVLLSQSINTVAQLRNGWQSVLDNWRIEAVLVPVSCALGQALLVDPEWHTAFIDSKAVLLTRSLSTAQNAVIVP